MTESSCNSVYKYGQFGSSMPNNYGNASFNNLESHENKDILMVLVYLPFDRITRIKVNRNSTLMIFNKKYPEDSKYIFKGEILDQKKTFIFYNIENDNVIVLLSSKIVENNPKIVDRWISITYNKDDFQERMKASINQSNRNELSRLQDLRSMKREMKRKKISSELKSIDNYNYKGKYLFWTHNNSKYDQIKLNINYKQTSSPTEDPLPIIW